MPKAVLRVELSTKELRDSLLESAKTAFKDRPLGGATVCLTAPTVNLDVTVNKIVNLACNPDGEVDVGKALTVQEFRQHVSDAIDDLWALFPSHVIATAEFEAR